MKHCPPYMACPHELPTAAVFYRKSSQSAFQYGWRRGPRGFVPVALLAPGGCWDRRRHFSSGRLLLLRGLFHIHAQVSCTGQVVTSMYGQQPRGGRDTYWPRLYGKASFPGASFARPSPGSSGRSLGRGDPRVPLTPAPERGFRQSADGWASWVGPGRGRG